MTEQQPGEDKHENEKSVEHENLRHTRAKVSRPEGDRDHRHEEGDGGRGEGGHGHAGGTEAGEPDADQPGQDHTEIEEVAGVVVSDDLDGGADPRDEKSGGDRETGAKFVGEIGRPARGQQTIDEGRGGKHHPAESEVGTGPVPALDGHVANQRNQQHGQGRERHDEIVFGFHVRSGCRRCVKG